MQLILIELFTVDFDKDAFKCVVVHTKVCIRVLRIAVVVVCAHCGYSGTLLQRQGCVGEVVVIPPGRVTDNKPSNEIGACLNERKRRYCVYKGALGFHPSLWMTYLQVECGYRRSEEEKYIRGDSPSV